MKWFGRLRQPPWSVAAASLGQFGTKARAAVPSLSKMLKGDRDWGWAAAAISLWRIDMSPTIGKTLNEAMGDSDPDVRLRAYFAVGEIGPGLKTEKSTLLEAINKEKGLNSVRAAFALWQVHESKEAIASLVRIIKDANQMELVRLDAISALHTIGPPAADTLPVLHQLLKTEEDDLMRESIRGAIKRIDPKENNIRSPGQ